MDVIAERQRVKSQPAEKLTAKAGLARDETVRQKTARDMAVSEAGVKQGVPSQASAAMVRDKRSAQDNTFAGLDVYFISKPRNEVTATHRKQGLLQIVRNDLMLAQKLIARERTRIARNILPEQARAWVKRLKSAGWHVQVCRGNDVCYSSITAPAATLRNAGSSASTVRVNQKASKIRVRRMVDSQNVGSFCLPVNWVAMPQLNPNASLAFGDTVSDLYWIAICQTKLSVGALVPLAHYAKAACEAATHWVEQGKLVSDITRIPGHAGYMAQLTGVVGDAPVTYLIGIFEARKHFYCCYGWTTREAFGQYRALFQGLAASFRAVE